MWTIDYGALQPEPYKRNFQQLGTNLTDHKSDPYERDLLRPKSRRPQRHVRIPLRLKQGQTPTPGRFQRTPGNWPKSLS